MLRERMNADDDVRTPFFKNLLAKPDASPLKKLARFGTKSVDCPKNIFHPMLFVPQNPIINADEFARYVVRFFNRFDNAHGNRFAGPKLCQSVGQSLRRRTMSAACVGRYNENFWSVLWHFKVLEFLIDCKFLSRCIRQFRYVAELPYAFCLSYSPKSNDFRLRAKADKRWLQDAELNHAAS